MKLNNILPKISRTTLSYAAGIITALVGFLVLIGWQLDIEILKSLLPGAVSMKANTAAAFLLAGLTLILLQRSRPIANALVRFCALVIALVGFLSLCEYLFAWNLGIDEILFREPGVLIATLHPGRMAPNTALNFALLGFAFFVLTIQRFRSSLVVEFPLIFSLSISVIGLTGYVTGLLDLTGLGPVAYTKIAVHTAGAFIILCIGMLFTAYGQQRSPVTIEQKLFAGITVSVVVIIFITLLSVSSIQSLRQESQKIMDAKNQQHQLENVLQLVLEVQSGQCGFLIAGDDKYLIPPKKAILELLSLINNLHLQLADNPHLQQNFESLVQLVEAHIAFFDQVVLIRKTKGEAKATSFFATGKGEMITDSIRVLIPQMIADEGLVLQTLNKTEEDQASRTQLIIFVSLAFQVLLLAFIFVVVYRDVIGRKKAEEKLHKLNEELEERVKERTAELAKREDQYKFLSNQLEAMLDHIPGLIFYKDTKNNFVHVNKYVADAHHTTKEELENKSCFELYPEKDAQAYFEDDLKVISSGQPKLYFEEPWETENGVRWVSTSKVPFVDIEGKIIGIIGISFDITERKQAEEEIKKAHRIYAVLSNINQTIVRVKDKQTIYDEACRIAVEDGKFRMAWIGMVDQQSNKVNPVASAGFTEDYLKTINIDLSDEKLSQCPTGRAIKSGVHYLANDIANNPEMIPCRENALRLGYKSSAAFPIKVFGKTVGAFILYAGEEFFFDKAEVNLLDELAMDISFVLEFLQTEFNRKLFEEELMLSEEKYRSLVDNALVGVYETNLDGEILFTNKAFVNIFGFKSLEELRKTKIQERYANVAEREKFINILKENGYAVNYELDFITLDKQIIHAILSAKLQNDRITCMFLDLTDKKKVEKELLENEKRLRSIINSTPLGSHVYELIDDDLILIDANSSASIILGVDHKKFKNKNIKDVFPLLGSSGIIDEFKNVAITGKSFTKHHIISGEGSFNGIFEFFAFQIKNNSMALFFRDVTEQKKLELRIQKSEERFKLASQATHDSIWDWDFLTNKIWWSKNMNEIFDLDIGNTETDIKKWYELIHPADLQRVKDKFVETLNGLNDYWNDEYRLLKGDGNYAYVLDRGYIIRDKYRKPIRMVGSILDYTEKIRYEQDLIAAKEKAEEANRLKSGFISAMSHEIRTPLNIILGYNDLIGEMYSDPANEETQTYFNSIKNNGYRLIDTITKILDISRIEAGEFPISLQPIPIKEILNSTYGSMKILADQKKLKLVLNLPGENLFVLADTYCLENALINLVNNAIKYSEKGRVEISLKKEEQFAVCKIKDEGIGMSENYQKYLFQTFSQEKVGTSRPYEGVGLGLALTKKYMERMQAGIEIQSMQGLGTTVILKLPIAK